MRRLCGARRRFHPGVCRQPAVHGSLRCRHHGGAPGSGVHLSDDAYHSRSIAIARAAAQQTPHTYNKRPEIGGLVRATTAIRGPDGRFLPNASPPLKKTWAMRSQGRALAIVIQLERAVEAGLVTFEIDE